MITPEDKARLELKQTNEKLREQKLAELRRAWLAQHIGQTIISAEQEQIFQREIDAEIQKVRNVSSIPAATEGIKTGPETRLKEALSKMTSALSSVLV